MLLLIVLAATFRAFVGALPVDCDSNPASAVPQGIHLAFAGNASTSVAISFFTCGDGGIPLVELTDESTQSMQKFVGSTSQYKTRRHHDVVLMGLRPGTEYMYTVSLTPNGVKSEPFRFRTAPLPSVDSYFVASVIGDMGVNGSAETIARLTERGTTHNFTIHLGDVAYADTAINWPITVDSRSGRSYDAAYDLFQNSVEPVAARSPYMAFVGNHDVSCNEMIDIFCGKQMRNFSAFRHRFRMPSVESGAASAAHHNMWYSWRVGAVHFAAISTESDYPGAPFNSWTIIGGGRGGGFGNQLGWLRKDLAAARADPSITWIVVMGHRPWYGSVPQDSLARVPRALQTMLEPLFHEIGVDVWLCGHKHYYERTAAALNGQRNDEEGTVTIINGGAGNNENTNRGDMRGKGVGDLTVAVSYDVTGFGELAQLNATALRWRYFTSAEGALADEVFFKPRLFKPRTPLLEPARVIV